MLVQPEGIKWEERPLASGESFTSEMRAARFENWVEGRPQKPRWDHVKAVASRALAARQTVALHRTRQLARMAQ